MAQKTQVADLIRELCEKKQSCWVLISCGTAGKQGDMPVELYFDGDPSLACYLLEDARKVLVKSLEGQEEAQGEEQPGLS